MLKFFHGAPIHAQTKPGVRSCFYSLISNCFSLNLQRLSRNGLLLLKTSKTCTESFSMNFVRFTMDSMLFCLAVVP